MVYSENRWSYFLLEFYSTCFLTVISIFLFWGQLSGYNVYLALGCILCFGFGGLFLESSFQAFKFIINISTFLVLAWIAYSIVNSSFFYRDVILICGKGLIFLEIVFCFGVFVSPRFLSYSQALSLPLFISWLILIKECSFFYAALALIYIITLLAISVFKFRGFFSPHEKPKFILSILCPSAGVLLLGIAIAWIVSGNITFKKMFIWRGLSDFDSQSKLEQNELDSRYYELQDKLQDGFTNIMPSLESVEDRRSLIMLLSHLIKDDSYVAEVDKASQGLIDLLRRPGAGLEKNDAEGLTILLNNYLQEKASFRSRKEKNKIMDAVRNNSFDIMEKASISMRANNIQHSDSYEKVFRNKEGVDLTVDRSLASLNSRQELKSGVRSLSEWKVFELGIRSGVAAGDNISSSGTQGQQGVIGDLQAGMDPRVLGQKDYKDYSNIQQFQGQKGLGAESLQADGKQQGMNDEGSFGNQEESLRQGSNRFELEAIVDKIIAPRLISIIISPQNARITMYGSVALKVEGYFEDSSHQDVTSKVDWKISDHALVKIDQGMVYPLRPASKVMVSAQYSGIESSPARIAIVFTKWQIFLIIIKLVAWILIGALNLLIILYFLTLDQKSKLRSNMDNNPRQFMVNLYDNILSLLNIFGAGSKAVMPPLLYANMVEDKYSIGDALFLRFTNAFLEAKYSSHPLQSGDALVFLENYNALLRVFISRQGRTGLFFKYCLTLWKRRPLFL